MVRIKGFQPITNGNAKILILGSMPSDISLQKQEYYGHERNAFWSIMSSIFNENENGKAIDDYSRRKKMLIENNIALWDVLQSCHRAGSLDTAIKMNSIKINDFYRFFSIHRTISHVFFNGGKVETIFKKHVLPIICEQYAYLQFTRLPSTSPAHAAMTLKQKTDVWKKEIKAI